MIGWILSIVGIVFTSTLAEIMLPEGETAKYIKGVISLVVIYVILLPIPKIKKKKIDINSFFNFSAESYESDPAFIQIIKEDKQSLLSDELTGLFREEGLAASADVILGEGNDVRLVVLSCHLSEEDAALELTMRSLGIKEDKIVIHEVAT